METIAQGIIHGTQIDLDRETGIPAGSRVRIQIERIETMTDAEKLSRLKALLKELGEDQTFVKALEAAYHGREADLPREVKFDVAP
jgi:hypothetical protein